MELTNNRSLGLVGLPISSLAGGLWVLHPKTAEKNDISINHPTSMFQLFRSLLGVGFVFGLPAWVNVPHTNMVPSSQTSKRFRAKATI